MGGAKRRDAPKKRKPVSTKIKKKKEGKTETGSEKIETCFEPAPKSKPTAKSLK